MAKKKSKTQKMKKNLKKKMNKAAKVEREIVNSSNNKPIKEKQLVEKDKVKYNVALTEPKATKAKKTTKASVSTKEAKKEKASTKKNQLVEKSKVKYNVPLTEPETLKKKKAAKDSSKDKDTKKAVSTKKTAVKKTETKKPVAKKTTTKKEPVKKEAKIKKTVVKTETKEKTNNLSNIAKNISEKLKEATTKFKKSIVNLTSKPKKSKKKQEKIILPKKAKPLKKATASKKNKKEVQKKNIFIRLAYEIITNIHILFNAALIIFFIVLLVGMKRIEVLTTGTIIYISAIVLFLILIALSYNKYLSGKIFTIVLCAGMGFAIYHMQYTYDFVRNLVSSVYEYKTYYVVTFDNGVNKSIYTINNKSVGLLKDNCINVERRLNTKLDDVHYMEYDDINLLFEDFYNSEFRAILVNENQYKYLQNNIQGKNKVKILYEFKVNEKK